MPIHNMPIHNNIMSIHRMSMFLVGVDLYSVKHIANQMGHPDWGTITDFLSYLLMYVSVIVSQMPHAGCPIRFPMVVVMLMLMTLMWFMPTNHAHKPYICSCVRRSGTSVLLPSTLLEALIKFLPYTSRMLEVSEKDTTQITPDSVCCDSGLNKCQV